jgi:spore coat protein U-like protein
MCRHSALTTLLLLACAPAAAQQGISCSAQMSPSALAFGNYVPSFTTGVSRLLGNVVVACANSRNTPPNQIAVRISLSAGQSGTTAQRRMATPGSTVPLLYNLYMDAAFTAVWPDATTGPGEVLPVPPGKSAQLQLPVYGRIPAGQTNARLGPYSDSLVLTIVY